MLAVQPGQLVTLTDLIDAATRSFPSCRSSRARKGDLPQAIRILKASLALRDRTGHRYGETEVRLDLGVAYRGLGRLAEAQQEHEVARSLAVGSSERHVEAAALNELGLAELDDETGR
ncbi:tetratricopeptide repeat protein [Micromonospora sp. DT44]|uniref:tetratricopeptide repeat protein n=1 Tax=Micromonospora sp. DT44 TaxID=3393439 RepID=UPI003CE8ABBB